MGGAEVYKGFWWGNLSDRDDLEDPGVDGRIILRWIFRKWDVRRGMVRCGSSFVFYPPKNGHVSGRNMQACIN
jgi:hypothetical protein